MRSGQLTRATSLCVVRALVSAVRGYWSAVLLGVAAIVLLALGAPTKAALAGAGFAFIGAAITRGIDLANERRAAAVQADADRRRDLDETRRLLRAALVAGPVAAAREPMLVATLVNALAYHGLGIDPAVANGHLHNLGEDESRRWAEGLLDRITAELGDGAGR
jgi:hypothetical protein